MGFSIIDPHPNNECLNWGAAEAWFSFIFCGSKMDGLNLHVYDYYSGEEIAFKDNVVYQEMPALTNKLTQINTFAGNGVRINVRDFTNDNSVFKSDGEYTWRAEIVQDIDPANEKYPDNMVYEGVLIGEPTVYADIANISGFDYDNFLPLNPDITDRIKPPYYVDFLDSKYGGQAYDIPITYAEKGIKNDGTAYTSIRLTTYSSSNVNIDAVARPSIGSRVLIHKKKNYGTPASISSSNPNVVFIDPNIQNINATDLIGDYNAVSGCYMKVGDKYYKINAYNKTTGAVTVSGGDEINKMPAGTHYSIYTSHYWTPYYYFRVHTMPMLNVSAEFHERRKLDSHEYDMITNCLENTANGILFKARFTGDSHAAVKYHYWDVYMCDESEKERLVYHTEKIYSAELDSEVFVPFGHRYKGKITIVTQDGVTIRGEATYDLPASPELNNALFNLRAIQNKFGGVELAWGYRNLADKGSTILKATDFEVWREDLRLKHIKYLGKVDCSPIGLEGVIPAASGFNWYLIDKDCDFKLKTPKGANVNMYLIGGGCDGGSWTYAPNSLNKSFCNPQSGGGGGYFLKTSTVSGAGMLEGSCKIAKRNDIKGTTLTVNDTLYRCSDTGSERRGNVSNGKMTQTSDEYVIYSDGANGSNGFETPYGILASSGGGGEPCGNNKTYGGSKSLSISGVTPKYNKGTWILIDRDSLGGASGSFDLNVPPGSHVRMYLVGGGKVGGRYVAATSGGNSYSWDVNASLGYSGGEGGYVLTKTLNLSGNIHVDAIIADRDDVSGTSVEIDGNTYKCNDSTSTKTPASKCAASAKNQDGTTRYEDAENGRNGVLTPYGYVGSSGGGGGSDNMIRISNAGKGGIGAGDGGSAYSKPPTSGANATNYGCGGGGGAAKEYSYSVVGAVDRAEPGKGMPGCIIFEIDSVDVTCPNPGIGGIGAGDGGTHGNDGLDATRYGCGGGGSGYFAMDSDGNYTTGDVGLGYQGCIILEIDLDGWNGNIPEQVYAVDWTAGSDKSYRYIVTGCNYETDYHTTRHNPEAMIECTGTVDITPHFEDFYLYFLNEADVLVKKEYELENYDIPLTEPMGRYVTSRNNNYRMVKRRLHSLAVGFEGKSYYRRHAWRIEGDVELGEVTHNITRNVSSLYARMPSVTSQPTDYDSFPVSFLFGYLECDTDDGGGFVFDDQYLFELWKKCVFGKQEVMIKDPKGNVWTGAITEHSYQVEYDTNGMPYNINFEFVQTHTEDNSLVMIVDSHNEYLKTAKGNHLR